MCDEKSSSVTSVLLWGLGMLHNQGCWVNPDSTIQLSKTQFNPKG